MAKIGLSSGFSVIPEGTYVFKIESVEYKEAFGKMTVNLVTKDGQKHQERFSLLDSKGGPNQGALNAFSYFAKTALDNFDLTEIEEQQLVGKFIECDVEHDVQPNRNHPEKTVTFVRLADKRVAHGFDVAPASAVAAAPAPAAPAAGFDLNSILG